MNVTIDGIEYTPVTTSTDNPIVIAILQRGWVFVGRLDSIGDDRVLTDAFVIRQWGTTKGLGEIAKGGPTSKTVLDPAGTVRFRALGAVATIDCVEDKWASKL